MLVAPRSATRTWPASAAERQLARWPPAGARPDVALDDEAAVDQLADALGDDRRAEAGPLDQLRPRPGPSEADLVEDDDERVEGLVRDASGAAVATRRGRPFAVRGLVRLAVAVPPRVIAGS